MNFLNKFREKKINKRKQNQQDQKWEKILEMEQDKEQ